MNSPEMHVAGGPYEDADSEEVRLLRGQITNLCGKIASMRAKWSIAVAIAIAGFIGPIATLGIYAAISDVRDSRLMSNYAQRIARIAAEASVAYPTNGDVNLGQSLGHVRKLIGSSETPPEVKERVKKSLLAAEIELGRGQEAQLRADENASALAMVVAVLMPWLLPILYVSWISQLKRIMERAKYKLEYKIVEAKARHLQDKLGEDFFTRLVQINFKYLDQYYFQTHQQANKSFGLSVAASIVGLTLVVAAIGMMLANQSDTARLTAIVGGLSQFIAAVFFYLYNRTVLKMGEYHKKLVLTQNIGIALKITDLLPPGEKAQAQCALVGQLTFNINQFLSEIETSIKVPVAAE